MMVVDNAENTTLKFDAYGTHMYRMCFDVPVDSNLYYFAFFLSLNIVIHYSRVHLRYD